MASSAGDIGLTFRSLLIDVCLWSFLILALKGISPKVRVGYKFSKPRSTPEEEKRQADKIESIRSEIPKQVSSVLFSFYATFKVMEYYLFDVNDSQFSFTIVCLLAYLLVDSVYILSGGNFMNRKDLTMLLHHLIFTVETAWFVFHPKLIIWTGQVVIPFLLAEISTIFLNSRWLVINVAGKAKSLFETFLSISFLITFTVTRVIGYNVLLGKMVLFHGSTYATMDSVTYIITITVIVVGSCLNFYWLALILKAATSGQQAEENSQKKNK